jgi:membrane protein
MKQKIKKLYDAINGFSKEINEDHVRAYASSAAFFMFLSLIPYLILIISVIPYTPLTKADVLAGVVELLPDALDSYAISIIDQLYANTFAALSFSIIAVIWSSAQGLLSITNGLNSIYDVDENRNYFFLRARAGAYTLVLAIVMIASLMLSGFGREIHEIATRYIPKLPETFQTIINFRILLTLSILTCMFAMIFRFIPNKKQRLRDQLPGAFFTAVGWTLFSWAFSVYINLFNAFTMYGSLTTVVIIMLWLYAGMYIMFIGAEMNSYFEDAFEAFFKKRKERRKNMKQGDES